MLHNDHRNKLVNFRQTANRASKVGELKICYNCLQLQCCSKKCLLWAAEDLL